MDNILNLITEFISEYNVIVNIGHILIFIGLFINISAIIGVIRFPDFFTRIHSAGIIEALGLPLILIGLILISNFSFNNIVKILIILIILYIVAPTISHLIAKIAIFNGEKPLGEIENKEDL